MKKPRSFLEMSTVGVGAVAGALGQQVEKGRWEGAALALPGVAELTPTPTQVLLDDGTAYTANTLLVTISNTPQAGAGLELAPSARLDDGLLDVRLYQDLDQAALVRNLVPTRLNSSSAEPEQVWRGRARSVEVHTAAPMPVSIESKLVGVTPARFTVQPGALYAVVGDTDALLHPAAPALVHASRVAASALGASPTPAAAQIAAIPAQAGLGTRALRAVVPVAGRGVEALASARSLALPLATAAVGLAAGALLQPRRRA